MKTGNRMFEVLLAATVVLASSSFALPQRPQNFRAHLSDEDNTGSPGQGEAVFQLSKDGNGLHYKLIVANIENVTMAHIHVRPNAETRNGPIVLWLYPSAPPPILIEGRSDGVLAQGTATSANLVGPLAGQDLSQLIDAIRNGLAYVNVHTQQNPGGEIRGDIR
jgi:hypothetical protein